MLTDQEKLAADLEILEAMAAEMADYLLNDLLFQQMAHSNLPKLTLGGFLMRQHRLLALQTTLLNQAERMRLEAAVEGYNEALLGKGAYFEVKANRELGARLRQWEAYLKDLMRERGTGAAFYHTGVETRAMISGLVDELHQHSQAIKGGIEQKLQSLDQHLRRIWGPGDFVWPADWQPAYPQDRYWWLYGLPRKG